MTCKDCKRWKELAKLNMRELEKPTTNDLLEILSSVGWSLTKNHKSRISRNFSYVEIWRILLWYKKYTAPHKLILHHPLIYIQWMSYKSRIENPDYNYWLICYAFGI